MFFFTSCSSTTDIALYRKVLHGGAILKLIRTKWTYREAIKNKCKFGVGTLFQKNESRRKDCVFSIIFYVKIDAYIQILRSIGLHGGQNDQEQMMF